jgi:hypothetical protein
VGDELSLKIFMTQVYKVLKDFELNNEQVRSGQEVACRAREAEKLMKEGFLIHSNRELDPNDKKDKELIDKCAKFAKEKHAENHGPEKAEARQKEVDEREATRDEEEAAKAEAEEVTEEGDEEEEDGVEEEAQDNVESPEPPKRTRRRTTA